MAGKTVVNASGAFGYSDLETTTYQHTAPFKASSTVAAKAVVAIGTDATVATAATNGTASLTIGIAQTAIASGNVGNVILGGIAEDVPCDGAVAAGDLLKRSVTTAGRVATTATPAAGEVLGVAINASSGGTVDVMVFPAKVTS
jgi:hypothetical protein